MKSGSPGASSSSSSWPAANMEKAVFFFKGSHLPQGINDHQCRLMMMMMMMMMVVMVVMVMMMFLFVTFFWMVNNAGFLLVSQSNGPENSNRQVFRPLEESVFPNERTDLLAKKLTACP